MYVSVWVSHYICMVLDDGSVCVCVNIFVIVCVWGLEMYSEDPIDALRSWGNVRVFECSFNHVATV